jgi:hypothetical protein
VNVGILPVPLAPKPIEVLLFVQVNVVPATAPVKLAEVEAPLHTTWLDTAFTVGVGFTVYVNVRGVPGQEITSGTTIEAIAAEATLEKVCGWHT